LQAVRDRVTRESPEFDRWGIHVMASQTGIGEVTIGDSHEYGDSITPFDRAEIDDLIINYLRTFIRLPDVAIAERWHGIYAKRTDGGDDFIAQPAPGVTIVNGVGGAGMTTSFGLAEEIFAAC
jgi:glycine/D-amino acid oxidase-like deaminating enzyme